MRAVVLDSYGGPEVLAFRDIPDPEPGPGQVGIRVRYAALNRADLLQRMGKYPPPGPKPTYEIPGLEYCGEIDALGSGAKRHAIGDRVFGLLGGGAYAQRVVVNEDMAMPVPEGLSSADAAAVPEAFLVALDALTARAELQVGDDVLVHAVGSGVGTAAVQVARFLGAGHVYGTSRTAAKLERARELGLDEGILTAEDDFAPRVLELTKGRGVDVILDFLAASTLAGNLDAAARDGRIVLIALLGGARAELNLAKMLVKHLRIQGTTLRSRPEEEKVALTARFVDDLLEGFVDGSLRAVVDRIFPFEDVADAHGYMHENRNFGKVLLRL